MKKILKKEIIISFIVGVILASSIAVYASISASEVDYKNGQKVSEALDDLYIKTKDYKKLDATTTASASDILKGKTAYDNLGNLITGNFEIDGVSGIYNKPANTYINIDIGFTPSKYVLQWTNNSGFKIIVFYDKDIQANPKFLSYKDNGTIGELVDIDFIISGNRIIDNTNNTAMSRYLQSMSINYMAFK